MKEKREQMQREREENKRYIQMVLDKDERDNREQKEKAESTRAKLVALQKFQKMQAGEEDVGSGSATGARSSVFNAASKGRRGKAVGGPMNLEEVRMNKQLLKEMAAMKKQTANHSQGGMSSMGMSPQKCEAV